MQHPFKYSYELAEIGIFFLNINAWDKPEGSWCDSCATQVEWTQAICLHHLSKVSHRELQVLWGEELISNVKFSQCLTPLLSHHMDAWFRCWWAKAAAEILPPEQTFKLWQITQCIKWSVTMLSSQKCADTEKKELCSRF